MTGIDDRAGRWLDGLSEAVLVIASAHVATASAGAARLLGTSPEALAGRPLDDLVQGAERSRLLRLIEQVTAGTAPPRPLRVRLSRLSDRQEVPVDLRLAADGDQVVLCARDATATARAEDLIGYLAQLTGTAETFADVDTLLDTSEPIFQALGWVVAFIDLEDEVARVRRLIDPPAPPGVPALGLTGEDRMPVTATVALGKLLSTGRSLRVDDLPSRLLAARPEASTLADQLARRGVHRAVLCPVTTGDRIAHVVAVVAAELSDWDFVAIELFAAQLGSTLRLAELRAELVARERLAGLGDLNIEFARRLSQSAAVIEDAAGRLGPALSGQPTGEQLLVMLREEVARLGRLAGALVAFARPVSTRVTALDLAAVLDTAVAAARDEVGDGAAGVAVSLTLPPDLSPVAGDAQLLPEALAAMLVNAFQHQPEGGRVVVSATEADGRVRLVLANDGPAIGADAAPRVFEPFFTTKATGTGLGLAMVRRTIEELGGTVTLEPTGTGVAFALTLRAAR